MGLTSVIYKQPYVQYLKTIEYNNNLKKCKEKKEENDTDDKPIKNSSTPMDCPDHLYLKPEVCYTF